MVSVDLVEWQETNMFLSLTLPRQFLAEHFQLILTLAKGNKRLVFDLF